MAGHLRQINWYVDHHSLEIYNALYFSYTSMWVATKRGLVQLTQGLHSKESKNLSSLEKNLFLRNVEKRNMEELLPNFSSSSSSPSHPIVKVTSDDVENNSKVKMTSKDAEIFKSKSSSRLDRPEEQDLSYNIGSLTHESKFIDDKAKTGWWISSFLKCLIWRERFRDY